MTEPLLVNVEGEVADEAIVQTKAAEYADLLEDERELKDALGAIKDGLGTLDAWFRDWGVTVGMRFYAGQKRTLCMTPPKRRAPQTVNKRACESHSEGLLDLGLGRMAYLAPTAEQVRENAARIIAAGIPLDEILPTAVESGIGQLEIVREGE